MDVFFIYGLYDDAEPHVIRYVGQTKSLYKRIRVHYGSVYSCCGPAGVWKWSVLYFGRQIHMRLLEVVYGTRRNAIDREAWHIADQQANRGRLVNKFYAHQLACGIPATLATTQIELVHGIRSALRHTIGKASKGLVNSIARSVDRLGEEYPSLLICTNKDSYSRAVPRRGLALFRNQFCMCGMP